MEEDCCRKRKVLLLAIYIDDLIHTDTHYISDIDLALAENGFILKSTVL
jgi:hypothetical protein